MGRTEIHVGLETIACARSNRELAHFLRREFTFDQARNAHSRIMYSLGPFSLQLRMFANKNASARPRTPAPICAVYRQPTHYASVLTRVGFEVRGNLWAGSRRQPTVGRWRVEMAVV